MYRKYERGSLKKFAARHGFAITEGSTSLCIHEKGSQWEFGCQFWLRYGGKYEFYFHPNNYYSHERNLAGIYVMLRGRRYLNSDSGTVRIDTRVTVPGATWNGGKPEYYALTGPFVGEVCSRPEDMEYFRQFFQGDMPEGIFRDWLVDNNYLSR